MINCNLEIKYPLVIKELMTVYWWSYSLSWHHLGHAVCQDTKYTPKFVSTKSRENQTTFRKIFPLPHYTPQTKRTAL